MTVTEQPRIINGMEHQVLTVGGLDRCQINTRLHFLNVEIDKLRAKQSALIEARNQMDRQHNNVVNGVIEEIRYYQIEGWKRLTVTRVPASEVTAPYARLG